MKAQFTSPIRLPRDPGADVPVEGPLLDVDPEARKATVVCLLVQAKDDDPDNAVWVEGRGEWSHGEEVWSGSVSREGTKPDGGSGTLEVGAGEVRGIAMATIVRDGSIEDGKLVPPSLETITWCVGVRVENDDGQTSEY
jgi:hypothetical protein